MKKLTTALWLLIITFSITSCGDDLPIDQPVESKIALKCTATLNDTNEDELAQAGETITYTYTFKNLGDEKITNLVLNDEGLNLVNYVIDLNQLLVDSEYSITYDYTLTQDDLFENSKSTQTTISGTLPDGTIVSDKSDALSYESDGFTVVNFTPYLGPYQLGYFITNEGVFNTGTGTITFIGDNNEVSQQIYQTVNNENLGNVVQSMTINEHKAYIVVNNSHKVVVVNRYTFVKEAIIAGDAINNPRYFIVADNKGYISNWGETTNATDDFITVIDLTDNSVITTIPVGEGPEKMLVSGNKLYVNLKGGWGFNNKVEVIDITSNTVASTITVGDIPNNIIKDNNDAIWVLCSGKPNWSGSETAGKLVKIENDEVSETLDFEAAQHPDFLNVNNANLIYYLNGSIFNLSTTDTTLPTTAIAGLNGFYYNVAVHDGKLYTTNAGDFASEGTHKVFDLSSNTELNSFSTGIIPGGFAF